MTSIARRGLARPRRVAVPLLLSALLGGLALPSGARAPASAQAPVTDDDLEVYLLTAGPGDAVWERFGHDAIWFRDLRTGLSVAYHWGLFDFFSEDFVPRLVRGRMRYWMGPTDPDSLVAGYVRQDREVIAQQLNLSAAQKEELLEFVRWNALEENRFYRYDYYRDNCSTRLRDALDRVLGGRIRATLDTVETGTTYRWHTRRLTFTSLPVYSGIELVLGPRADQPISAWDEMFLPMELAEHLRAVRVTTESGETEPLVMNEVRLHETDRVPPPDPVPSRLPFYLALGGGLGAVFVGLGLLGRRSGIGRFLLGVTGGAWSLLAGAAGLVLVLAWIFTDHTFWFANENLFQFSPLSALLLFLLLPAWIGWRPPASARFVGLAVAGISLLGFAIQGIPAMDQVNGEMIALALPAHVGLAVGIVLARRTPRGTDV